MSVELTVVIPTYNGANRLPLLLDRLQNQTNTKTIVWEIIVVDNNSTDDTAKVVREYQANWQLPYALKYCLETEQGAAFARKRGVQEACGTLIGFLDDDNIPELDWVAAADQFSQEHPNAGAYGSQIHGEYEVEPPPNFKRIEPFLAITERGANPLLYNRKLKLLPPSAGLVVRKEAWLQSIPSHCILRGRVPGSMVTGEDLEVLAYIQQAGWEIWYNPKMELVHKIPSNRLTRDYLISFMGGIGLSRYVTRTIGVSPWLKPLLVVAYAVNDLRKIILHFAKYGRIVKEDLVAACELELLLKSLISPWYLWQNGYLSTIKKRDFLMVD